MMFKFYKEYSFCSSVTIMQPSTSKDMQPSTSEDLKPLRKMRALSGFNAWHSEYLQSAGLCNYNITLRTTCMHNYVFMYVCFY